MKLLVKIVNGCKPLTIFIKSSFLDIWQGFEYAPGQINEAVNDVVINAYTGRGKWKKN